MRARHWMQIAAVASAVGLTGTAIANDMDRTPTSSDDTSATVTGNPAQLDNDATTPSTSALPGNAVTVPDYGTTPPNGNGSTMNDDSGTTPPNGNGSTMNDNSGTTQPNDNGSTMNDSSGTSGLNDNPSTIENGAAGTTQGSTMVSPKSDTTTGPAGGARDGSGSSATSIGGSDRLGSTNSENFDQWASDYAAHHNGRITRQEFIDQMGNRWDVLDSQHRGYLTPQEMQEFFIATPGETAAPSRTGSDAQAGDMGPGSTRGD
jgi:hypothetical protein